MSVADWFPADEPLRDHEIQALQFLASNGPHQVGVIDDEERFAAAMVFVGLTHKGMVVGDVEAGSGPTYHLTAKGRAAALVELHPKAEKFWEVPVNPDGWSDWSHPLPGYRIQCCDCGLIHEMEFAIVPLNEDVPLNDGEDEGHVIVFRARRASGMSAVVA